MQTKIKVVLLQLGSPKSPKISDVRAYLKEFLGDPRVVDVTRWVWFLILNLFVLPFRPKKSAELYARIWDEKRGFPLVYKTNDLAQKIAPLLDSRLELNTGFLLSTPRAKDVLDAWESEDPYTRAQEVLFLPLFPQYAESTIASVLDGIGKEFEHRVNVPSFTLMSNFHRAKCFIDNSVKLIDQFVANNPETQTIVISFHGIPLRRVLKKKDIYFQHCHETYELIKSQLKSKIHLEICFQSRFGSEIWLGPSTEEKIKELKEKGITKIAFYCPSFVIDCLETTVEIGYELHEYAHELGVETKAITCLNDNDEWCADFAKFINISVLGSRKEKDEQYYEIDVKEKVIMETTAQAKNAPGELTPESKKTLKIMFITMFLDLVGFSIIFPMFPSIAKYYLTYDSQNQYLQMIFGWVGAVESFGNSTNVNSIVLFGGILGAIYSLLQFIAAPIWGAISDRVGRKPVLLISVFGLLISYIIWFFSGSFTLLLLARLLGGLMSGNLSIASAVVADITDEKNRSKGMAVIGIAFAFGFIFGPAIGGALSMINLVKINPALGIIGVNPFSVPALFAAALSFLNLFLLIFAFKETLPKNKRNQKSALHRSANPFFLFKPLPFKGVNQTNFSYFLFICAFSGMEFTLTFLAVERFAYTSMDNAYMFVFIGLIIGLVQGGYVRRKAHTVGEIKMSVMGLGILIPGLLLVGYSISSFMMYAGLLFLAVGSAMVIPCITSLVSLYTPSTDQGHALGIFRSLGSLGRMIGPLSASLVYWKYGGGVSYLVGAIAILIPLLLVRSLPKPLAQNP
jgi:ferrochelatase